MADRSWECKPTGASRNNGYVSPYMPVERIGGTVFVVSKDGTVECIQIYQGIPYCPEPGSEGERCVGCWYNVPKRGPQVTIGGTAVSIVTNTGTGIG